MNQQFKEAARKDINCQVGEKIKLLRKTLGLNQEEFAASIGLTRTSVVNIEKGRQSLTMDNLYKIVTVYSIDFNDVFQSSKTFNIVLEAKVREVENERDDWKKKYTQLHSALTNLKQLI